MASHPRKFIAQPTDDQLKKFPEAMALIDKEKEGNTDEDFQKAMDLKKKDAVTLHAISIYIEGKQAMEAKDWDKAVPFYERAAGLIYENIDLFDVNKEVIDSWLDTIKTNVKLLDKENADQVDEVHNKMLKQVDEAFEDKHEQLAIKVLINGYYHVGIVKVLREKGSGGGWGWNWLWWIIAIIIISSIFGSN